MNAQFTIENKKIQFNWTKGENTKSFVIYQFKKRQKININKAEHIFLTTADNAFSYVLNEASDPKRFKYVITAISKSNLESKPVTLLQKR